MDEKELLRLLAQGNPNVFAQIYDKYWQKLFAYAYSFLKDTEQCEDVLQDVFTSLWERKEIIKIDNLNAYLFSSVRYSSYKQAKQRSAREQLEFVNDLQAGEATAADNMVISSELNAAYEQLLDEMPPQRKRVFQMRYEENLTTKTIAEKLKIAQKTVQNHLLNSYQQIQSIITSILVIVISSIFRL